MKSSKRGLLYGAIALFVLAAILYAYGARRQSLALADACDLAGATTAWFTQWPEGDFRNIDDKALIAAFGALTGTDMYVDTGPNRYWRMPADVVFTWEVEALTLSGDPRWFKLFTSPTQKGVWIQAFRSWNATTDANGEYYGYHDICAAWTMDNPEAIQAWAANVLQ